MVPYSTTQHLVGCHCVFRLKHHPDGSNARQKAHLVAKGFHQAHGIDYNETFSLVVKPATIRVAHALAVHFSWPLHQLCQSRLPAQMAWIDACIDKLDVTNAFLHGILQEGIYVSAPGFC